MDILVIALAVEINKNLETVFAYFNDDLSKKSPTVGLTLSLLYERNKNRHKGWGLFAPDSRLRDFNLLHLSGNEQEDGLLNCHFRLDERIKHFLIDNLFIDSTLTEITELFYPGSLHSLSECRQEPRDAITNILKSRSSDKNQREVFWLYGKSESDKRDTLLTVANKFPFTLLIVDLEDISHEKNPQETFQALFRESILQSALIYFTNGELLYQDDPASRPFVRTFFQGIKRLGVTFIGASSLWVPEKSDDAVSWFPIECKSFDFTERKSFWQNHLKESGISEKDIEALSARYGFNEKQIKQTVNYAKQTHPQGKVSFDSLCRSANLLSSKTLNKYSKRIEPHFAWDDIVLPKDKLEHLREITSYIKNKQHVFHTWGFIEKLALGRGVNALFSGASGTGKTMAADIMAAVLKLELYKVDLSSLVSKYIGETEKNLNKVFDDMSSGNTILFFDEADALFGKRTEVKDAHDRYANIETNYLLQKIEEHEGMVILATNLIGNIDEAFSRRMHFVVDFPFPEPPEREKIWRQAFPKQAPLSKEIDFPLLAKKLKFSGGSIKNIVISSAFFAIEENSSICMRHILSATQRECQKTAKPFPANGFDKYLKKEGQHANA